MFLCFLEFDVLLLWLLTMMNFFDSTVFGIRVSW